jgi:hypothetical protein
MVRLGRFLEREKKRLYARGGKEGDGYGKGEVGRTVWEGTLRIGAELRKEVVGWILDVRRLGFFPFSSTFLALGRRSFRSCSGVFRLVCDLMAWLGHT